MRRCLCRSNCYSSNLVLHVVLPLTSYDLYSQILSVYERSIKVFLFFFLVVFTSESGNLLTYKKNIYFLFSLERPMETSWRNTASRHRDNVHVYDKWPVWGYFRVDQPTSTCFKWHTSISVYLQRTSGCSNSHERRCSTRNLDESKWRRMLSLCMVQVPICNVVFSLR